MDFLYDTQRPWDLICMGRVAVDLYAEQIGCSLAQASSFKKYLGGCAGNIAVGTARLGLKTAMYSCVGQDEMGAFLLHTLQNEGVNTDLVSQTAAHLTGLVLLGIKPPHEFPLIFYRKDCADMQTQASQITQGDLEKAKAILMTGTALSEKCMRANTNVVAALAKKAETAIVFDLDYRPVLWGLTAAGNGENRYLSNLEVSAIYQDFLPYADLIVGTEEEVCIAGGSDDVQRALESLRTYTSAPVVLKCGERGCAVHFAHQSKVLQSEPFKVVVLNVLGAGDAFMSGLLFGLLRGKSWHESCSYANAAGAIVVTRHGCAPAMPYEDELLKKVFGKIPTSNPLPLASLSLTNLKSTLIKHPIFPMGTTPIVNENHNGMRFSSIKLKKGESYSFHPDYEFAALLLTGKVEFHYAGQTRKVQRFDYFTQAPFALHAAAGTKALVRALSHCELLLIETENQTDFAPVLFDEDTMLESDHRGIGLLENTSYRLVRTVFDKRNRPDSNLVLGEIVSFQGRWSSYPSHHHPQPEVYHYRFSEPQGYAFGELGKEVLRIEHNDTYCIPAGLEHAHCVAPGYRLYTLWFIRHLPGNPYLLPSFLPEHEWTRTPFSQLRIL